MKKEELVQQIHLVNTKEGVRVLKTSGKKPELLSRLLIFHGLEGESGDTAGADVEAVGTSLLTTDLSWAIEFAHKLATHGPSAFSDDSDDTGVADRPASTTTEAVASTPAPQPEQHAHSDLHSIKSFLSVKKASGVKDAVEMWTTPAFRDAVVALRRGKQWKDVKGMFSQRKVCSFLPKFTRKFTRKSR